jgi:hypothetical protein
MGETNVVWPNTITSRTFLGEFAKLRKATVSFVMSVLPFPCNISAPTGRNFIKFDISVFFGNPSKKNYLIKTRQERKVFYIKTNKRFWSYVARFFLEWIIFQTKFVEKIDIHILCSIFFSENHAVYQIMWKNRPEMTIWHIRIVLWVPDITTHTINM